jgi:hypothetical protein
MAPDGQITGGYREGTRASGEKFDAAPLEYGAPELL